LRCAYSAFAASSQFAPSKRLNGRGEIYAVDAADIDRPPAWIEARPGEGMDAAVPARVVLGGHRVELVQHQFALSGGDAKVRV
jgi:hypothetical protein